MWVGIDDTDSPKGGCTTWALTELLDEARATGVDLIGEPRLVRLNPNIPWKTRGNAALAARFGLGRGRRRRLGELGGAPVWSFERSDPLRRTVAEEWVERAWKRVLLASRQGEPGTDPALVAVTRPLPASLYWNAVREVVDVAPVRELLDRLGATVRTDGADRGLIGAAAAVAWPGAHPTWEMIAYRTSDRIGQVRAVNAASVRAAERRFPGLFLCRDPRTRRLLVTPHTNCPILFGLRGVRPSDPLGARRLVRSEPVDRWLLFRTNQASGDHLAPRSAAAIPEFTSATLTGTVAAPPETIEGGHVRFGLVDEVGAPLTCLAFEPTKTLPAVVRSLREGDRLRVWGSRTRGDAFHLEGIELQRLVARASRPRAPECPGCRRRTRSLGRLRGYRCVECRRKLPPEAATVAMRTPDYPPGVYHPTPSARRHLAPRGP
ncbi:MAG TPA: tRNA(Ile)(2)-agmatinylcytidine synthase [Thermoplasmata archaeon]|nr:tRNA(Ile)(2)-agmatinylcytidine synthase [Thermoplasmata archaeon]